MRSRFYQRIDVASIFLAKIDEYLLIDVVVIVVDSREISSRHL